MLLDYLEEPSRDEYLPRLERRQEDDGAVLEAVSAIIDDVRRRGDAALYEYEERFDASRLDSLTVSDQDFDEAEAAVDGHLKEAIDRAIENIRRFHEAQLPEGEDVETAKGVRCWRRIVPISNVGLYIPGGTAPLFSTVLMLAIPARVAGCRRIVLCTPPHEGRINPAVLYAARRCGVDAVYKVGGAQAIAAMAYGTGTVPKVDKIFGPGNRYVAQAKSLVGRHTAIDMVAGPSEVMVVADSSADPMHVASDLLSQAEHGRDSQVILLIHAAREEARAIYGKVEEALSVLLGRLGRHEYMLPSLSHSCAMAVADKVRLVQIINEYAPEHLIIDTVDADGLCTLVESAGSIFLGPWSPESAGDYASGTNHTLPTSGWAHSCGGVSTDSFLKKITVQKLSREGLMSLADTVVTMAEAEDLMAHAMAVKVRLQ